jgi:hypothetical protein
MGPQHLEHLDTIVDPLVVTDLHTLVWSPHGHPEAVDALLRLAQIVLVDSVDEPVPADAISRVVELMPRIYVVDLAWLRSTPVARAHRRRVRPAGAPPRAAAGSPSSPSATTPTRRSPASSSSAGWAPAWAGRARRSCAAGVTGGMMGTAEAGKQDVRIRLEMDPTMSVRGLAGLTLGLSSGETLSLDRGAGGLHARREDRKGRVRDWTVVGASRGEAGILGEGIRQALLRDPTYKPALECAQGLVA